MRHLPDASAPAHPGLDGRPVGRRSGCRGGFHRGRRRGAGAVNSDSAAGAAGGPRHRSPRSRPDSALVRPLPRSRGAVDLYYTREPLERAADWPAAPCGLRPLRTREDGLTYYEHLDGWSLLVDPASDELPPAVSICGFVDAFVEQHLLFSGLEGVEVPGTAPIFPAVIEL